MDYFRLNMRVGFSANAPTIPAPISPPNMWVDVSNWQNFLNTHTPFHCNPVDDCFKANTEEPATKQFQASNIGGVQVPQSGKVDPATFAKAVAAGMPNYPTVNA